MSADAKKPDGGPAFPFSVDRISDGDHWTETFDGITVRDYFAAHAPAMPEQWFKDSPRKKSDPLWHWGEASAAWAFYYADAMLAERNKP